MLSPHEGTVFPEDLGSDWGWWPQTRSMVPKTPRKQMKRFGPVRVSHHFFADSKWCSIFFDLHVSRSSCTNCGYSSKKIDHCCNTTWHLCSVAALPFCLAVLCWWTMVLAQVEKAQLQELVAPPKKSWFTVWSSVVMCKSFEFINCWRWQ